MHYNKIKLCHNLVLNDHHLYFRIGGAKTYKMILETLCKVANLGLERLSYTLIFLDLLIGIIMIIEMTS